MKKVNWGIIGVGNIAQRFVKSLSYSELGELYAVATTNKEMQEKYQDYVVYDNYDEILNDEKVDAIYVATPHLYHYQWSLKAIQHGKHVLCEKPAMLSSKEMLDIIDNCNKHNVLFMEALKTKFTPGIVSLKDDLVKIGKIKSLEANFCFDARGGSSRYLFDPKQGGAINDVSSYLIGFIQYLFDGDMKVVKSDIIVENNVDVEFNVDIQVNNILCNIEGSVIKNKERYALITGELGQIKVPYFNRVIDYKVNDQEVNVPIINDDMFGEIEAFNQNILNNQQNKVHTLNDTLEIIKVVEDINKLGH